MQLSTDRQGDDGSNSGLEMALDGSLVYGKQRFGVLPTRPMRGERQISLAWLTSLEIGFRGRHCSDLSDRYLPKSTD